MLKSALGRALVRRLGAARADDVIADVAAHLRPGNRILDVGAGTCQIAARLVADGFAVTAVDVRDQSCEPSVVPELVDGLTLPFAADAFDVALLITVLHHTRRPDHVLAEAARVARRVIVQEDIHDTEFERRATMVMDSVVNLELLGHPHSNRSDQEWRAAFARLGLEVVAASRKRFWRWFQSATYLLEPSSRARSPAVPCDPRAVR